MRGNVQEYDRNRKRVHAEEFKFCQQEENTKANERKKQHRFNSKVIKEETNNGFTNKVKTVFKTGLNSPRKREILFKYCEDRGYKLECPELESNCESGGTPPSVTKSVSLLQLKAFKLQHRVEDHRKMVEMIKTRYGSLNKAAKALNIHYCTLWNLCQTPTKRSSSSKKRVKIMHEKMETLSQFYTQKSVTTNVPTARQAKKHFLISTYDQSHSQYVKWCEENDMVPVPFGTFYRLKPKDVYCVGKIPENQCCCRLCQNFQLDKCGVNDAKIKGIGSTTKEIILGSLCPVTDTQGGVIPDYGYYNCISRNCKHCGKKKTFPDIYIKKIVDENPGIETDQEIITWKRWEFTIRKSKSGKDIKRLFKFTKRTTRMEFLKYFINDLNAMALHLFNWKWHDTQFDYIKANLLPGMVLQVLDFAQNYMNKYQDEPKECHWDHAQTVIHPIINHRRCPHDGKLIVEEHIIISDDLNHDKYAVQAFEDASLKELETTGFVPLFILQFCDNCSSQYKSKGPFEFVSTSVTPKIRSYFGPNHGKGPSDSATGRIKCAIVTARNARVSDLKNPKEVYEFLTEKLKVWEQNRIRKSKGKCIHFFQKAIFVTDIDRTEKLSAVSTSGSKSFSTVRSTGTPFIVEARNVACLCPNCLFGDVYECPNKHYSGSWVRYNLKNGKQIKDPEFINTHWGQILNSSQQAESSVCESSCNDTLNVTDGDVSSDTPVEPDLYTKMKNCDNFEELKAEFEAENNFDELEYRPAKWACHHILDTIALPKKPKDAPTNYLPVHVTGDGNCFTRALAIAIGLDPEAHHLQLRMRICREGVMNKERYLNHGYVSYGVTDVPGRSTLPIMYAQFSDFTTNFGCVDGESRRERLERWATIAEKIYEAEMYASRKKNEYMGVWQILQAANCIGRPICSVYPEMFTDTFRRQLNRTFFPFPVGQREKEPIYIMWTSTIPGGRPNHFVPLLKY